MEFSDKVVFVAAAAGAGIGQAVARTFASEGAIVVLSDQHPERTAKVAADIADDTGQEVTGVTPPVTVAFCLPTRSLTRPKSATLTWL